MTKKLLFILFIIFGFVAKAQIPKQDISADISVFPIEKIALSINSNVLLAGELLQYKAFNLDANNKESKLSNVLYVSMRNENDSVVFSHKLKIKNGAANGDFFIPSKLKTGVYKLIGYTSFSRNSKQNPYALKNIYVINSFVKAVETNKKADIVNVGFVPTVDSVLSEKRNNNQTIRITSNKLTYGFREKVNLNLEAETGTTKGDFILSVRRLDPIEISGDVSEDIKDVSSDIFYVPELRGELISGVVLSNGDGAPAPNKVISLTIPGKNNIFKIATTDANGRFFFSVTEGYDAEKSIIQLNETDKETNNFTLILDKKDFNLGDSVPYNLKLSPEIKNWLQERSVQVQVENAYFETKKDSIINNNISSPFYNDLGTVFILDDFTRFSTVSETFVEVVTLAAVRGTGENSRFLVNNAYDPNRIANFNDLPPLILMDGMQIINNEYLINFNARDIKSIRVVTQPYRYGAKIYSGIIAVETKKGDFKVPRLNEYVQELDLPPAVKDKDYYRPNYKNEWLFRIPDYRVQLLWQPKVIFKEEGFLDAFYTSDVPGAYQIKLEGFNEKGDYISEKANFIVK